MEGDSPVLCLKSPSKASSLPERPAVVVMTFFWPKPKYAWVLADTRAKVPLVVYTSYTSVVIASGGVKGFTITNLDPFQ